MVIHPEEEVIVIYHAIVISASGTDICSINVKRVFSRTGIFLERITPVHPYICSQILPDVLACGRNRFGVAVATGSFIGADTFFAAGWLSGNGRSIAVLMRRGF